MTSPNRARDAFSCNSNNRFRLKNAIQKEKKIRKYLPIFL